MPFSFLHSLPPKNSNYNRDHKDSAEQAQVDGHGVWAQLCCSVSCWPRAGWIKTIPRQADLLAVWSLPEAGVRDCRCNHCCGRRLTKFRRRSCVALPWSDPKQVDRVTSLISLRAARENNIPIFIP